MSIEQKQIDQLESLRGTAASHYELANKLEELGFEVLADPDDNERSIVFLKGVLNPDGSNIQVAEIVGDCEARIV